VEYTAPELLLKQLRENPFKVSRSSRLAQHGFRDAPFIDILPSLGSSPNRKFFLIRVPEKCDVALPTRPRAYALACLLDCLDVAERRAVLQVNFCHDFSHVTL